VVILYGSRARGRVLIDAWLYPLDDLRSSDGQRELHGGRVLLRSRRPEATLQQIQALVTLVAGPRPA
jgi:hypothetical protein